MTETECSPLPSEARLPEAERSDGNAAARVRAVVGAHYDFVWRTMRYLGIPDADAQDGAQQVMCVLARRLTEVELGSEKPFLFATAVRVAAGLRRSACRRHEAPERDIEALAAATPSADELLDQRRAHDVLHEVLEAIPVDLRLVFVLYEVEELTSPEIAEMLGIPLGTVASRLRRGRDAFQVIVKRMQAAQRARGEAHE